MICPKCSQEVQDGQRFCTNCGAELNGASAETKETETAANTAVKNDAPAPSQPAYSPIPDETAKSGKNAMKSIILIAIGIVALIAVVLGAVFFISNLPQKVNVNEYISVKFDGYDTMGTARIEYDEELLEVIGNKIGLSKRDFSQVDSVEELLAGNKDDYSKDVKKLYSCMKALDISLDKSNDLSNGDSIKLKVEYDNEKAKEYGIKFVGEEASYTVKDLKEINFLDPFADYKLTFSGTAPNGTASGEYTGPTSLPDGYYYIDYYYFGMDKSYNLKNGDTVTVTINLYSEDDLLERGYMIKELSKTYTVEGLDEYVGSYSQLTSDYLDYAKSEANDIISSYIAKNYNNYTLNNLDYAGYLFISPKSDVEYYYNYNYFYLIYKGTVAYESGEDTATMELYFPVMFYNILSTAEGLTSEKNDYVYGYSSIPNSWYSIVGYTNPVLGYSEMISNYSEEIYQVEAGDGFEEFSEYTTVETLSDIGDTGMKALESAAIDTIEKYVADSYSSSSVANDLSVMGYYLLVNKNQTTSINSNNKIYVVYQATVSNTDNAFETATVFYPVEISGLVKLSNGDVMFVENRGIQGYSYFESRGWYSYSTKGYLDGTQMFNDLVTQNRNNYSYEMSENLKQFGE